MSHSRSVALFVGLWIMAPLFVSAQTPLPDAARTQQYAIEVAGIRVGTMTTTRQPQADQRVVYTLVSDFRVNLLLYKVTVYYKVTNLFERGKLIRSVADAQTNQGNFLTQTQWTGNHYAIDARQYKWTHEGTEPNPITYTITDLFFTEPTGRAQAFTEYFGDYFSLSANGNHTYLARREGRVDEYVYENGQLVWIIKKNPVRNFIIRRI